MRSARTDGWRFEYEGRLGTAAWLFASWSWLVAAYFIFGMLWLLWQFVAEGSGTSILLGVPVSVVVGPVFGLLGFALSWSTLLMAPIYLMALRRLPSRWRGSFRPIAIVLAPPLVGSLTFSWWFAAGLLDWYFTSCLVVVLLIYGAILPSPFEDNDLRHSMTFLRLRRSVVDRP